jgi:hypothetical protein
MKYKIIDNFLPKEDFKQINDLLTGPNFPWYYNKNVTFGPKDKKDKNYYFNHRFYEDVVLSNLYDFINEKLLSKIDIFSLKRVKANFHPRTEKVWFNKKHIDYKQSHKGCIYYINTCDGFTVLEDGKKIESIENRALFFDPSKQHNSSTCSNAKGRINININYI